MELTTRDWIYLTTSFAAFLTAGLSLVMTLRRRG